MANHVQQNDMFKISEHAILLNDQEKAKRLAVVIEAMALLGRPGERSTYW